jgi:phage terminase small subunit
MEKKPFTAKQAQFIKEYPIDFNGTQAAIRAGYAEKGANVTASKLLTNPNIAAAIQEQCATKAKDADISLERILKEYKSIAYFDIAKLYNEDGDLKKIHEIDEETRRAISSIESDDLFAGAGDSRKHVGYTRKVKACSKRDALADLMRHVGGFEKDNAQQNAGESKPIVVADIKDLPLEQKMKILQSML